MWCELGVSDLHELHELLVSLAHDPRLDREDRIDVNIANLKVDDLLGFCPGDHQEES